MPFFYLLARSLLNWAEARPEPVDLHAARLHKFLEGARAGPIDSAILLCRARDFFDTKKTPSIQALLRVVAVLETGVRASEWLACFVLPIENLSRQTVTLGEVWDEHILTGRRALLRHYEAQSRQFVAELDVVWDDMACEVQRRATEVGERARERVTLPIERRPDDLAKRDAHRAASAAHAAASRFEDACYELERATALDPTLAAELTRLRLRTDVENFRSWAERHVLAGKKDEAIECYTRLLRRDPGDDAAKRRLAELELTS